MLLDSMMTTYSGGGFSRGDPDDLSGIMHLVWDYMQTHGIPFVWNGHSIYFSFAELFLGMIAIEFCIWAVSNFYLGDMHYGQ